MTKSVLFSFCMAFWMVFGLGQPCLAEGDGSAGDIVSEQEQLDLKTIIDKACRKNITIRRSELGWDISKDNVDAQKGVFEPDMVAQYTHLESDTLNNVEEVFDRGYQEKYIEQNNDYSASIKGLLPTGMTWSFGYTFEDSSTNLIENTYGPIGKSNEYEGYWNVTVKQPLLKGAGTKINTAKIRAAEADEEIAFQSFRLDMMKLAANAMSLYWDLYYAQSNFRLFENSVALAERLLESNKAKVEAGKLPATEVYEARAGLALRRSRLLGARQEVAAASNQIRTLIAIGNGEVVPTFQAVEAPGEYPNLQLDYDRSVEMAFGNWPEYLARLKAVDREGIQLEFDMNQRLPQVDLSASYQLNGLGLSPEDAWEGSVSTDHPTWSVGLGVSVPLFGGQEEYARVRASEKRKKQALLDVKAVELALINGLRTKVRQVVTAREQVVRNREYLELNRTLLDIEMEKFEMGMSTSDDVLEKEEKLNAAIMEKLRSVIELEKSVAQLKLAEGVLLQEYSIKLTRN